MDPVDEFAKIKSDIRRLKKREAELRTQFLDDALRLRSNQYEVVVRHQKRRVFLKDKLPIHILLDDSLWETRTSEVVTVKMVGQMKTETADDFDVIE